MAVPRPDWQPPGVGSCRDAGHFSLEVRGLTWNARALFCADPQRMNAKIDYLLSLIYRHSFVALQEAHGGDRKHFTLDDRIAHSHVAYWSDVPDNSVAGGVGLVVDRSFYKLFDPSMEHFVEVIPGRVAILFLEGSAGRIGIGTVHIEPSLSPAARAATLASINRSLQDYPHHVVYLAGDWNSDTDELDRYSTLLGKFCGDPAHDDFEVHMRSFTEIYKEDFV